MKIKLEIDITSLVIGAAIGIIVGVGIMLALGCRDSGNVSGRTPHEVLPPHNEEYPELARYLNSTDLWNRRDLAGIPHGVEFYDVLNDGDRVAELQEWCIRLKPDVEIIRMIYSTLDAKFYGNWTNKRILFNNSWQNAFSRNGMITPRIYINCIEGTTLNGTALTSAGYYPDCEEIMLEATTY